MSERASRVNPPDNTDDPRPQPPAKVDPGECCGNGCDPCVYDIYNDQFAYYLTALAAWQARHPGA